MPAFAELLNALPADHPRTIYRGPGTVAFWNGKASVELVVHATHAADVLGTALPINTERGVGEHRQMVNWTLPFARRILRASPPVAIQVEGGEWHLRDGEEQATITGSSSDVTLALYGRRSAEVAVIKRPATSGLTLAGRLCGLPAGARSKEHRRAS
jgi:hypothetical protein